MDLKLRMKESPKVMLAAFKGGRGDFSKPPAGVVSIDDFAKSKENSGLPSVLQIPPTHPPSHLIYTLGGALRDFNFYD